jgi:hypothetical protein
VPCIPSYGNSAAIDPCRSIAAVVDEFLRRSRPTLVALRAPFKPSAASWHVQNGTPLAILMQLGGWASYAMVLRYAHLAPSHLAAYA